jgi:uncharacterized protein
MTQKGIIVSGEFGSVVARQKSGTSLEVGELLIIEEQNSKMLLQVVHLFYGSQLNQQNLELISGLQLEEDLNADLIDASMRNYLLAKLKTILLIEGMEVRAPKNLPKWASKVRAITENDLAHLASRVKNPLQLGLLRSARHKLKTPIVINGRQALSHHMIISGTTGRGKSVLMSNLLWELTGKSWAGMLVLDPHDEYYGRSTTGLKDHEHKDKVVYYTPKSPPVGAMTLRINVQALRPKHFTSLFDWSDAQSDALGAYYRCFGKDWIEHIIKLTLLPTSKFHESTLAVIQRRMLSILSISVHEEEIVPKGIFSFDAGQSTVSDIVRDLGLAKTVIIDTSQFSGSVELLIGSLMASAALERNRKHTKQDLLSKPIISVVLEEAPRVLGKDVLEKGTNIFSTIAREGRKFNVGLIGITQLPSLIPREILANMNTKIILGTELKPERRAIIESASQDLSDSDRMIASLDRGEAIVTSNFLPFATPIAIPLFNPTINNINTKRDFGGFS